MILTFNDYIPDGETLLKFITTLGWAKGVFALFFFMAHGWLFVLYRGRLKDRQKEIDRLAQDNREYRDRFLKILDEYYSHKPESVNPPLSPAPPNAQEKTLPESTQNSLPEKSKEDLPDNSTNASKAPAKKHKKNEKQLKPELDHPDKRN